MYEEFKGIWITEPRKHIGNALYAERMSLDELYQQGWWITEIFGSYATVVKKSQATNTTYRRYYFRCMQCQIDTSALTPKLIRHIKAINNQHWKQYKQFMLRPYKYGARIKEDEL